MWAQTIGRVDNPLLPFEGDIPGGLQPGKQVFVQGNIPNHADGFGINFKCGRGSGADIAFHFNPRVSQGSVVRNTMQNGQWQKEEKHGGMPFKKETPFEIIFLVEESQFKIAVNGRHFTEFQHRIPLHKVQTLQIPPGVSIFFIRYDAPYPAAPAMSYPSNSSYPPQLPAPVYNPPIPYMGLIPPYGLQVGKLIFISGITRGTDRFTVNIQESPAGGSDIAFHFDVRFNCGNDTNQIVRNSMSGNNWGSEERQWRFFPFRPQANFDLMILCDAHVFKVAVDGKHFIEYQHRLQPLGRFQYLSITGDIRVTQIRYQ